MCVDGKTGERGRPLRRRAQAGANAWRAVEGLMADRWISKRVKGKVMSTCVTPACLYGTETLALTELQQQRRQCSKARCEEGRIGGRLEEEDKSQGRVEKTLR